MLWIIYASAVLLISGAVGLHLGRFREAYTEMTGMMAGMTMGMLNGFVLGYAAGAYFSSMFWGNLVGILLGLALGVYFGRPGGLMGILDGGMGGVMGGSMGAMLALMMLYPVYVLLWTLVLLSAVYILGMLGLVVLIERSAPGHRALHLLAPFFTRAIATEIAEERERSRATSLYFDDYYAFLGVSRDADTQEITAAYLGVLAAADAATIDVAERALSTLSDPARRRAYDARLGHFAASPVSAPRQAATLQGLPRRRPARLR
jgi:hypothetical protein